ncbi:MAG: periplasmic heavy metal sensor [Gemmobacter sp.]
MTDPTSTTSPAPAARPPGRWLRVALAVSLALNLAVAGVLLGAWLRKEAPRAVAVRDLGFGPYAAALTDADRTALRRALIARAPDLRGARAAMRDDMAEVAAALRAEPFDAGALRMAMDRGAARTTEFIALGRTLLVNHIQSMTPESRLAFAERLERGGRGMPRERPRPDTRP